MSTTSPASLLSYLESLPDPRSEKNRKHLLLLAAGGYVSQRLLRSGGERRAETVERVTSDAMAEPLARNASAGGPEP